MQTFLVTLVIAFVVIVTIGLFINYSRRASRTRTRHGAPSTCQGSGGSTCCTCHGAMETKRECAAKKEKGEGIATMDEVGNQQKSTKFE